MAKRKNKNRKIMIIGAGGIGSFLIPLLDKTGLYDITVYDPDVVEIKNITYQNFDEEDVEKFKVKVMDDRYSTVTGEPYKVLTMKQVKGFDLVVCCADNLAVRRTLYASHDINWLDLRAQGRNGVLISYKVNPILIPDLLVGAEGSFSCQGGDWDGSAKDISTMHIAIAGIAAQWIQRWFNDNNDVADKMVVNV